jgi:flagellar biosynthesis protein FliR
MLAVLRFLSCNFFCLLLLILVVSFSLIPVQQAPRDIGIGLVLCNFANGV